MTLLTSLSVFTRKQRELLGFPSPLALFLELQSSLHSSDKMSEKIIDIKDENERLKALIMNIRDDLDDLIANIDGEVEIIDEE